MRVVLVVLARSRRDGCESPSNGMVVETADDANRKLQGYVTATHVHGLVIALQFIYCAQAYIAYICDQVHLTVHGSRTVGVLSDGIWGDGRWYSTLICSSVQPLCAVCTCSSPQLFFLLTLCLNTTF